MPDIGAALQRPIGPLAAWQWGAVIGGGYLGYRILSGKSVFPSGSTSQGGGLGQDASGSTYLPGLPTLPNPPGTTPTPVGSGGAGTGTGSGGGSTGGGSGSGAAGGGTVSIPGGEAPAPIPSFNPQPVPSQPFQAPVISTLLSPPSPTSPSHGPSTPAGHTGTSIITTLPVIGGAGGGPKSFPSKPGGPPVTSNPSLPSIINSGVGGGPKSAPYKPGPYLSGTPTPTTTHGFGKPGLKHPPKPRPTSGTPTPPKTHGFSKPGLKHPPKAKPTSGSPTSEEIHGFHKHGKPKPTHTTATVPPTHPKSHPKQPPISSTHEHAL